MASGTAGLDFSALSGKPYGFRSVAAAGTGQSTATALPSYSSMFYNVTGADGTKGVKLPSSGPYGGKVIVIKNDEAATGVCPVYPFLGGTINSGSANAAFNLAVGSTSFFFTTSTTNWVTVAAGNTAGSSGTLTSAHIFVGNSSNVATDVAMSGDISISNVGATAVTAISTAAGISVTSATTPQITTASGKTNTGYFLVSGKTSGSLKITAADATAQAVVLTTAAQTSGGSTLTIPDMVGAAGTFAFIEKAQTVSGVKTFTGDNVYSTEYKVLADTQNFDNQVGAGTTLTTLTGMSWTVVPGTYYFKFRGTLSITANNGLKMAFKLTTTVLTSLALRTYLSTDTDNTGAVSTAFTTATDQALIFDDATTVYTNVILEGTMVVGTGGTIALQAAEHTAHNDDCLILLGAFSQMTRVL